MKMKFKVRLAKLFIKLGVLLVTFGFLAPQPASEPCERCAPVVIYVVVRDPPKRGLPPMGGAPKEDYKYIAAAINR